MVFILSIPLRLHKKKINSYVLNEEKIYNLNIHNQKYVSPTSLFRNRILQKNF